MTKPRIGLLVFAYVKGILLHSYGSCKANKTPNSPCFYQSIHLGRGVLYNFSLVFRFVGLVAAIVSLCDINRKMIRLKVYLKNFSLHVYKFPSAL